MQIAKLIEVKSRARPLPPPKIGILCRLGPMIPFQTKDVFVVTSHIVLSQYGMHGIVIDSKPELLKVSEQKGPILQKSHLPG